jgi:hypothetical protein
VASDASVFVPTVRITSESSQSERDSSDVGRGGAFEFNYFHGRGSDTQQVGASDQPIKLGGANFRGPQEVQHDFTLHWYEVNARGRIFSPSLTACSCRFPDRALSQAELPRPRRLSRRRSSAGLA